MEEVCFTKLHVILLNETNSLLWAPEDKFNGARKMFLWNRHGGQFGARKWVLSCGEEAVYMEDHKKAILLINVKYKNCHFHICLLVHLFRSEKNKCIFVSNKFDTFGPPQFIIWNNETRTAACFKNLHYVKFSKGKDYVRFTFETFYQRKK